jgi:effector-binding domain-containing protein
VDYQFAVSDQPAQPVLSKRTVIPVSALPQELGKAYREIITYLGEIGEMAAVDSAFAAYYNMDMEHLDVEMGFAVTKSLPGKGEIKAGEIAAGKQVSYLYKGPFEGLKPVYNALLQWIGENGHTPTGIAYEFYYNSPNEVPESDLLTKIILPLE